MTRVSTKTQNRHNRTKEAGNVLFLILIAVALFAALSYAVTSSSRSGGGNVNEELLDMQASQIVQYATGMENAIMRMQITNKCIATEDTDNEISFDAPNWGHAGFQHSPPARDECKVFHPDGGGIGFERPEEDWLDSSASAKLQYGAFAFPFGSCVRGIGVGADSVNCTTLVGIPTTELILILPYLKKELCVQINNKLDVTNPSGNPPQHNGGALGWHPGGSQMFKGNYSSGNMISSPGNELFGKYSGCYEAGGATYVGTYHYYHVLIPR